MENDICCFCLNSSDAPLTDLFIKCEDGGTNYDRLNSSLSQLAKILNENSDYNYKLCSNCCDTLDVVYKFNQTCLHNIEKYITQLKTIKVEPKIEENDQILESHNDDENWKTDINEFIKTEILSESSNDSFTENSNIEEILVKHENEDNVPDLKENVEDVKMEIENPENKNSNCAKDIDIDKLLSKYKRKDPKTEDSVNDLDNPSLGNHFLEDYKYDNFSGACTSKSFTEDSLDSKINDEKEDSGSNDSPSILHSYLTDNGNLICKFCNKTFIKRRYLGYHMKIHSEDKPYKCDVCEMAFRHKCALTRHKLIHLEVKAHKCKQCGLEFRERAGLNKHHKTVHLGARPYECDVCRKSYAQAVHLNRHKRIHTGEKFPCDVCDKDFTDPSSLRRHKFRYHEKI